MVMSSPADTSGGSLPRARVWPSSPASVPCGAEPVRNDRRNDGSDRPCTSLRPEASSSYTVSGVSMAAGTTNRYAPASATVTVAVTGPAGDVRTPRSGETDRPWIGAEKRSETMVFRGTAVAPAAGNVASIRVGAGLPDGSTTDSAGDGRPSDPIPPRSMTAAPDTTVAEWSAR